MVTISRARRAELARRAQDIRRHGQYAGWPVQRIATAILAELPQVLPLEAWRWSYGWSRTQTITEVTEFYRLHRLGDPQLNPSMLCKYEHGEILPGQDYVAALCGLYRADPVQLGLHSAASLLRAAMTNVRGYRDRSGLTGPTSTDGDPMTSDDASALAELRESITLALEVEGSAGGPLAIANLQAALAYYDLHYSAFAPAALAVEVHRTRALVGAMLHQQQDSVSRSELRRVAGWLSALVGNLAFRLADYPAAGVHFATAARLGTAVGDDHLTCWSLGAHAMTARTQQRYDQAAELGYEAQEYAGTPLRRAQILAWALLPAIAGLRDRTAANEMIGSAQDQMAADPDGEQPGRFGFDTAELHLSLAEASLALGDHQQAREHARTSQQHTTVGRPGWAAATLVLARGEAARHRYSDAAALAAEVLDTIPAPALRSTSRTRLADLNRELLAAPGPGREAGQLQDRILALPALVPVARISDEPNGRP